MNKPLTQIGFSLEDPIPSSNPPLIQPFTLEPIIEIELPSTKIPNTKVLSIKIPSIVMCLWLDSGEWTMLSIGKLKASGKSVRSDSD